MSVATLPTPTILLVDDDPTVRFLVRLLVQRNWPWVRLLEAPDGAQGLAQVKAHCHETAAPQSMLVLLDLNMPVMDGLEFLHHYQQLPTRCHQTAAVVVSSTSVASHEVAQAQALASAWQPKPLRTEHLAQLLHQFLPTALEAA
jgi:CheY-like chemotaxis protein